MLLDKRRQHELCAHHSSNTESRGEIVVVVAQFDVITKVRDIVAHEAFDGLALGSYLERTSRIGSHRHIEMWHREERIRGAAGTEFHQRSGLYCLCRVVDF